MATLGNVPAEAYTNTVKDSFSGNGSTTAFTMSLPTVTNDVRVVVENVIQDPTVAYSVSGTTLTFTSAPPSGTNNIYVVHLGPAVMTTVPPAEIADATTFASSLTVQGAFTSVGIDDNADAVALTIDSSENVLVGLTATEAVGTNAGTQLRADGLVYAAVTSDAHILSRRSSDGAILNLRKDTTTVGSIGVVSSNDLFIINQTKGLRFQADAGFIQPCNSAGSDLDNTLDLGQSNSRFKDAYLSGGVYLGGTGSANKLDDYEEGTWTAGFSGTTATNITNTTGYYTKIGNTVHFSYYTSQVDFANSVTGGAKITGLPFNASNDSQRYGLFLTSYGNGIGGESNGGFVAKNDNYLVFMVQESNSEATYNNGVNRRIMVAGTYMVD